MKTILTAASLLLSSSLAHAAFPVEIFEYLDNVKLVAFVQQEDIDASANWLPGESELPMSINQAIETTLKYCKDDDAISNPVIKRIELRPVPHNNSHWHYLVMLGSGDADHREDRYFVVLMNGKVLPAINEPEGYK